MKKISWGDELSYTLSSCRWCQAPGEEAEIIGAYSVEIEPPFSVHCTSCGAKGPTASTREEAINNWNKRVLTPERVDEEIQRVVNQLDAMQSGWAITKADVVIELEALRDRLKQELEGKK